MDVARQNASEKRYFIQDWGFSDKQLKLAGSFQQVA